MCGSNSSNPLVGMTPDATIENTVEYLESLANTAATGGVELSFVIGLRTVILALESASHVMEEQPPHRLVSLTEDGGVTLSVVN